MKLLCSLSFDELKELLKSYGQPAFRAKQMFSHIVAGRELDEMSNVPKELVKRLGDDGWRALGVKIEASFRSATDGTVKYLYALGDGNVIEGVLMRYKYGNTLCVSTQVGCAMGCRFCASTLGGLVRDLTAGEILSQVIVVNALNAEDGQRGVTNVVLMGSGEPFDNYDNVTKFLDLLSCEDGLNVSKRNVSLSTCGLCDRIRRLADEGYTPVLTVSLHAPFDELRKKIMPIAERYSVREVIDAAKYYFNKTGRRVIFEYSLIEGENDGEDCAKELCRLMRGFPCHVNLIRLNYVKERGLKSSGEYAIDKFRKILDNNGVSCSVRRSMGSDIQGACGQLRRNYIEKKDNNDN